MRWPVSDYRVTLQSPESRRSHTAMPNNQTFHYDDDFAYNSATGANRYHNDESTPLAGTYQTTGGSKQVVRVREVSRCLESASLAPT